MGCRNALMCYFKTVRVSEAFILGVSLFEIDLC